MKTVPFFVADRPMSLRLLKGLPLDSYPNAHIGIMAHANTSQNFQQIFHDYPCDDKVYCDAAGGPCKHSEDITQCPLRQHILSHTVKMCDSGIFTREGATLTYKELFEAYLRMDVAYGIMIDVFRDAKETVKSAREALREYELLCKALLINEPAKEIFKLVAVAQGTTAEEYIQCYEELKELGFSHIAIGGLLRKVEKTARYAVVRSEDFMYEVLGKLRELYPDDWLFALGCFNPNRLEQFQELHTWGDYKGWIFQYKKKNTTLNVFINELSLQLKDVQIHEDMHSRVAEIQSLLNERSQLISSQKKLSKQLNEGKRDVKAALLSLYKETLVKDEEIAKQLEQWITHGLVNQTVERLVCIVQEKLMKDQVESDSVIGNIRRNRELKATVTLQEKLLDDINNLLKQKIINLKDDAPEENGYELYSHIEALIEDSERMHRFVQVRTKVVQDILAQL